MTVGELCVRTVCTAVPDETIREGARRMLRHSVGTLVVTDEASPEPRAIGIVTDRDIVLRCVAPGLSPEKNPLSAVMSVPAQSVPEDTSIEEALRLMSQRAIRRLVVTDGDGALAGILALDDVLELLVEEAGAIGRLLIRNAPVPG
ncbi:MAG: CBS domain-containing protein [Gemmatimonadota bacterium]|nr:CBS domain-containing protein [Gemmatimonadota bacterium]